MKEFQISVGDEITDVIGKISLTERFIDLVESNPEISNRLLSFIFENNEDGSRRVVGVRASPIPMEPEVEQLDNLREYRTLSMQLIRSQYIWEEDKEEHLLNCLDVLWKKMTPDERKASKLIDKELSDNLRWVKDNSTSDQHLKELISMFFPDQETTIQC